MNRLAVQFLEKSGRYRWRAFSRQGKWLGLSVEGSLEQLTDAARGASATLLLDGGDVLSRRVHFSAAEKKHLGALVPFELESVVAADISSLHVVLDDPEELSVTAVFIEKAILRQQIEPLENAGIWVEYCHAIPHLLNADERHWQVNIRDSGRVDLAWGRQGTSLQADMLSIVIPALLTEVQAASPARVTVFMSDEAGAAPVLATLRELLTDSQLDIVPHQDPLDAWQPDDSRAVNLRQGAYAAPVRWQRLWKPLRVPVLATAAALVLFVLTAVIEIQLNSSRFDRLQQQIEAAYRRAVSQGMLVDAEQLLMTQIRQLRGDSSGAGLMPVLDAVAPVLLQHPQINTHRLNFSASQGELAVTAASNADILTLTDALNDAGLSAQARNISTAGDRQQASLLISGGNL